MQEETHEIQNVTASSHVSERPPILKEKRRSPSRIFVSLLTFCENVPRKRTQIVYAVNLNFNVIKPYLKTLIDLGFLVHEEPYYWTTEKGSAWAHDIDLLLRVVDE